MTDADENRYKCDGVSCRAGFIELQSVHHNHINVEVWGIDPNATADGAGWVTDVADENITSNVELELDLRQALSHSRIAAATGSGEFVRGNLRNHLR